MSLPKEELTIYLPAEIKAKLQVLSMAKGMKMSKWAEFFLIEAVERKFMEAVSVVRAIHAAGFHTDAPGGAGKPPARPQWPDSAIDPDSIAGRDGS